MPILDSINKTSDIVASNKTVRDVKLIKRREYAVTLRLSGYSYREIYSLMLDLSSQGIIEIPASYDERFVHKDIKAVIEESKKDLTESAEMLRAMELMTLNKMQNAIMDDALDGNLKAVDRVLKIMATRSKYVPDLTEPNRIEVATWQTEILNLLKDGKITMEDVRDVSPELATRIMDEYVDAGGAPSLTSADTVVEGEFSDVGSVDNSVPRKSDT